MNSLDLLNTTIGSEGLVPFADRLESRLTPVGRLNLLAAAMRIAPEKEAIALCDAFLGYHSAGHPIATFLSAYDDAKWHASTAILAENKAYCLGHYQAMPPRDQAGFLAHVSNDREAA